MRLTPAEREAIKSAVQDRDSEAEVYVYGSRANDALKGGDIDLLVLSDALKLPDKLDILVAIKLRLGDQRIDLTLRPKKRTQDAFVASLLASAVRL